MSLEYNSLGFQEQITIGKKKKDSQKIFHYPDHLEL